MSPTEDKDEKKSRGIRSIDVLVTSVILGGVVASAYGIRRHVKSHKGIDAPDRDPAFAPSEQEDTYTKRGFFSRFFSHKAPWNDR